MYVILIDEFCTEDTVLLTLDMTGRRQNIPGHHFEETILQMRNFVSTVETKILLSEKMQSDYTEISFTKK